MSALVAYQSQFQRVTPIVAVKPLRRDDGSAQSTATAPRSDIATSGSAAAGKLVALLGLTGLSGPDGTTVADATTSTAAPADASGKLQQALSTLLDALKNGTPQGTADQDSAPAATPTVDDAIRTILGTLTAAAPDTTTSTAASTVNTDASGDAVATPAPKPNLDALNRVLAHYTAQSAAASTVVTLVR